jgi:5-methylthioadenosine/S-adenosylhomocysteine deaminase
MERADCIICAEYVLTMDGDRNALRNGAVAMRDGIILGAGHEKDILRDYEAEDIVRCGNSVLLPGFINTHSHAPMVFFRGLADDLPLKLWLEDRILPAEKRMLCPEFVRDAAMLACLEMLKAGVTTYNDAYFFGDSSAEAAKALGIRAVLGAGVMDSCGVTGSGADDYLEKAERFIERWRGDGLVNTCIAPHSALTCSAETLKKARRFADRLGARLHIHLSETLQEVGEITKRHGRRPVEYLEDIGFLDHSVIAAHCIHVSDSEIEILAGAGVSVSHCVKSNLKLASGIAPVPKMLRAGITVGLGTDGAASNNDLNIMGEMSTAARLHKATEKDPSVLDAGTALLMATKWGAEAVGLGDSIGSISAGKKADIISISLAGPHCYPMNDIYSHLVYAAMASDVNDVMVGGKLVVKDRRHCLANEEDILGRAEHWRARLAELRTV